MSLLQKILMQQPYSGVLPLTAAPEPDEISAALAEVRAKGISDRDSARVAAFAWSQGIEPEAVIALFRQRGTLQVLREELSTHNPLSENILRRVSARSFDRLIPISLAKELGVPDLGWAIAILIVADEADFTATLDVLSPNDDPSRIATLFMGTRRFIPSELHPQLVTALLRVGDPITVDVVIALLSWWIEMAVEREEMQIERVLRVIEDQKMPGAVVLGGVLNSITKYTSPPYPPEIVGRADAIEELIDSTGKKVFADSRSVNAALKGIGSRNLSLLAAMSRWRVDPVLTAGASKAMSRKAEEVLDQEFSSRQNLTTHQAALSSRVSKWSVAPLVEALQYDGIDITTLRSYFDSMATDAFSKMTRVRTFYEDRQRAIILLAVAAKVAILRADAELILTVRECAERLALQPGGSGTTLDARDRAEIEEKCDILLPEN